VRSGLSHSSGRSYAWKKSVFTHSDVTLKARRIYLILIQIHILYVHLAHFSFLRYQHFFSPTCIWTSFAASIMQVYTPTMFLTSAFQVFHYSLVSWLNHIFQSSLVSLKPIRKKRHLYTYSQQQLCSSGSFSSSSSYSCSSGSSCIGIST